MCPSLIFAASKIDEHPRKLRDIIHATMCVRFKTEDTSGSLNFAEDSAEYQNQKTKILTMEKILLQTCCFDLTIKHPYNYVLRNLSLLQSKLYHFCYLLSLIDKDVENQLVQSTWSVISESLKTTICIRFPPKAVSAAAIYFAAKKEAINLAELLGNPNPNIDPIDLEIFPNAPKQTVHEIFSILSDFYPSQT